MATYTSAQFDKAVKLIGELPKDGPVQPSTDDKLTFYGYFKIATVGDNTTAKPGITDFSGRAKWNAWNKVNGTSPDEAKSKYVETFIALLDKDGSEASQKLKAEVLAA
ncbi:hypothetical protein JCM6882_001775 [Rhodosporidiobolus microsporus]